jgi:hypothetical protein
MVIECTSKAKVVSAVAVHRGDYLGQVFVLDRAFDSVFAVGGGAPLEVLPIVDIGSREEGVVSVNVSAGP